MKQRGDHSTLDIFDWEPPKLVTRYKPEVVRAASLKDRISLAVAATLKESDINREEIAQRMSAWLGEDVSKSMLDAYASQAREDHTISFLRVLALIHVTGDVRLLQIAAEMFGWAVIDEKYLHWVEVGQLSEKKEELTKAYETAKRNARRGR
jgi:Mg-chelatase subunit ChlI